MLGGFSFLLPSALIGLMALPLLWWLLKVTPPRPQRIVFPPLKIMADLIPEKLSAQKTPWWLLLLRLFALLVAIMILAGPFWQRPQSAISVSDKPLILMMDTSALAAPDWDVRIKAAVETLDQAQRINRNVIVVTTTDGIIHSHNDFSGEPAPIAIERVRALKPQGLIPLPDHLIQTLDDLAQALPQTDVTWIASHVTIHDLNTDQFSRSLSRFASVTIHHAPDHMLIGIRDAQQTAQGLVMHLTRSSSSAPSSITLTARDAQGLVTGQANAVFEAEARETTALFNLPIDIRNTIKRVEITPVKSAAHVWLMDARNQRQRVGLMSGIGRDAAQPLLMPTHYLSKALENIADVRVEHGAIADAVDNLLNARVRIIMMADVGTLDDKTQARLNDFLREGGVLIRFAGQRLAYAPDTLTPVRLRRGGRQFGGALSWDQPKSLAPFPVNSPFVAFLIPSDVTVSRQLMAEPSLDLNTKTWAALNDGTPIVTAETRGEGRLVLFHMTADPAWSNLPLSKLFIDMLQAIVTLAPTPEHIEASTPSTDIRIELPTLPLVQSLDGFGQLLASPPASKDIKPLPITFIQRASMAHPAGWYGEARTGGTSQRAINVMSSADYFVPVIISHPNIRFHALDVMSRLDLRGFFLMMLIMLMALDTVITLFLGGHLKRSRLKTALTRAALILVIASSALVTHGALSTLDAQQVTAPLPASARLESALSFRLAYVITGDVTIDRTSLAGLNGLSAVLRERTSVEPTEPIGINLEKDELSFYPLLYWPMTPNRPLPSQNAIRRLDAYMKNGGTVLFDTKDANTLSVTGNASAPTPATLYLRQILATLDIPELEPLPQDHVLTRAFYLLEDLAGRYGTGRTWTERLPPLDETGQRMPARGGDGISPLIITSNDWASAWAVGSRGEPLFAIVGGTERQREMAYRAGVNLVMYALTGNYKADQVHVAPLLERLGQ
jgi:hypothetical protein